MGDADTIYQQVGAVLPSVELSKIVANLSNRERPRSEADVVAGVRDLLLHGGLNLRAAGLHNVDLESPVGTRRRIDIEAGTTVIEVKKDLRIGRVLEDAIEQLAGYVRDRSAEIGQPYVGMLTDGAEWRVFHLRDGKLEEVSSYMVDRRRAGTSAQELSSWLEAVFSTTAAIKPTLREMERRLGAKSPSYFLDMAALQDLWEVAKGTDEVKVKRQLWAKLVATALGTQFPNTDALFVQHTYLVISAGLVAHELLGVDTTASPSVRSLLDGEEFTEALIYNVVEAGFFDWVLDVPGGEGFVKRLSRRIHRFAWNDVENDVLKVLYESVIEDEQRKQLGEVYTPDWLAEAVVKEAVGDPLARRVHDPSCGSGTFLFHAVRHYLEAANQSGMGLAESAIEVTKIVSGIDIHPVAVTLARVTYLLAIGTERLSADGRGRLHIPVYLGDSCQWEQADDILASQDVIIRTRDADKTFKDELRFPRDMLADAGQFDALVGDLAQRATDRPQRSEIPDISVALERAEIPESDRSTLVETFNIMCKLHDQGRDGIWGYYVRNLVRPLWLAQSEQRVDVLIGNPPWLGYKFMSASMQKAFKERCQAYGLWAGPKYATQMDLSTFFVLRASELYLSEGGKFAFVVPRSVLSREHYAGFRSAIWMLDGGGEIRADFDEPWDLFKVRPHFFPYPAAVVYGEVHRADPKNPRPALPMPSYMHSWFGSVPNVKRTSWADAQQHITQSRLPRAEAGDYSSHAYHAAFFQGATLLPRALVAVEELQSRAYGTGNGRVRIQSGKSIHKPWNALPPRTGVVENKFLHHCMESTSLLPFRMLEAGRVVIPWEEESRQLLEGKSSMIENWPGITKWWRECERLWVRDRKGALTLNQRIDYMRALTSQFPISQHRVVYNKSGMHLYAAYLNDGDALVDQGLYWGAVESESEAHYLCAILNSSVLEDLITPLMSSSKDERDFHKTVFAIRWPRYNPADLVHAELSRCGKRASLVASQVAVEDEYFVKARGMVDEALKEVGVLANIDDLVINLFNQSPVSLPDFPSPREQIGGVLMESDTEGL